MLVETCRLGAYTLLHNPLSGAIILDASGEIDDCQDIQVDLAGSRHGFPQEWLDAGLFDLGGYVPTDFVGKCERDAKSRCVFALNGTGIALRLSDDVLARQLCCIMQSYSADSQMLCERTLVVENFGVGFSVFENEIPLTERHTRDEIRFFIIRQICETILIRPRVGAILHGSAVSIARKGLVFVGTSGVGKTTTALGLLRNGAEQLADDHVAIHTDGRFAISLPVPIGLKRGTRNLPEAQGLRFAEDHVSDVRDGVRYVHAPAGVAPGKTVEIGAVIFSQYAPDVEPDFSRITPEEGFIRSIDAGARVGGACKSIRPLARLFNEVPSYVMSYARSEDAMSYCRAVTSP